MFVESAHGDGTRRQREKQEDLWIAHRELGGLRRGIRFISG